MDNTDCINYWLTQAQSAVNMLFRRNLAAYDVTPAQYFILSCLWQEDGLSPSQLATLSGLDASTVTGVLSRMEAKGLVERRHCTDDRRAVNVYILPAGLTIEPDISRVIEESSREALAALSEAEQETLFDYLKRISEDVGKKA